MKLRFLICHFCCLYVCTLLLLIDGEIRYLVILDLEFSFNFELFSGLTRDLYRHKCGILFFLQNHIHQVLHLFLAGRGLRMDYYGRLCGVEEVGIISLLGQYVQD